jgi:uncharacterized membrane protein YsdA (DUF1294 family)
MNRSLRYWAVAVLVALIALAIIRAGLSPLVALPYALVGLVSFALYGFDKHRASEAGRRIPERTLHGVDLLFGILGGLLGQAVFRHKTQKQSFWLVSLAIGGLHAVMLLLIALALPLA